MRNRGRRRGVNCETQIKEAKERIEQVQARMEKARTRLELAERRAELAETRTELAETRTALAETRAEQAETAVQRVIQGIDAANESTAPLPQRASSNGIVDHARPLEQLTGRQHEILRHIAEGKNTKQIAQMLNLSPKTVEYHRARLMAAVGVHDIPGLVRLAVRAGLVPADR